MIHPMMAVEADLTLHSRQENLPKRWRVFINNLGTGLRSGRAQFFKTAVAEHGPLAARALARNHAGQFRLHRLRQLESQDKPSVALDDFWQRPVQSNAAVVDHCNPVGNAFDFFKQVR